MNSGVMPRVAEAPLESLYSHLLNEAPMLFQRWYGYNDFVILTPNPALLIKSSGQKLNYDSPAYHHVPLAVGKVMRHVDLTVDGVIHNYSEIEIISFYPEGSQYPIDEIDYIIQEHVDETSSGGAVGRYLQKILGLFTGKD